MDTVAPAPALAPKDDRFRVQVTIGPASTAPNQPVANVLLHAPSTLNPVEVIKLRIVKTVDQLMKDAYLAYMTPDNVAEHASDIEHADPSHKKKKFSKVVVEWEATRTRMPVTEVHDGNVEGVLERLRGREVCGDIVWLLF